MISTLFKVACYCSDPPGPTRRSARSAASPIAALIGPLAATSRPTGAGAWAEAATSTAARLSRGFETWLAVDEMYDRAHKPAARSAKGGKRK